MSQSANRSWNQVLGSIGQDEQARVHKRLGRVQKAFRWKALRRRLQRDEVAKAVGRLQRARGLVELQNHDERTHIDLIPELSRLTLDSATASINAQSEEKKPELVRGFGRAVQLLLRALENTASLGSHESVFTLFHAVQILLTDLFGCTSVHVYRVVSGESPTASRVTSGKAFELGTDMYVPIQALPVAFRLVGCAAAEHGDRFTAADGVSADVATCTIDSRDLADMRVVTWMEPHLHRAQLSTSDALAVLGRPEAVVSADTGLHCLNESIERLRRSGHSVRDAEQRDACYASAIRCGESERHAPPAQGDVPAAPSSPELMMIMSRTEAPLSADEVFVATRLGVHVFRALRDLEARAALKAAQQAKAHIERGVPSMAEGEVAIERDARELIDCDDAVLFLVKEQRDGRPELVAVSRDCPMEQRQGIYEHMEHLALTGSALNLKQGTSSGELPPWFTPFCPGLVTIILRLPHSVCGSHLF